MSATPTQNPHMSQGAGASGWVESSKPEQEDLLRPIPTPKTQDLYDAFRQLEDDVTPKQYLQRQDNIESLSLLQPPIPEPQSPPCASTTHSLTHALDREPLSDDKPREPKQNAHRRRPLGGARQARISFMQRTGGACEDCRHRSLQVRLLILKRSHSRANLNPKCIHLDLKLFEEGYQARRYKPRVAIPSNAQATSLSTTFQLILPDAAPNVLHTGSWHSFESRDIRHDFKGCRLQGQDIDSRDGHSFGTVYSNLGREEIASSPISDEDNDSSDFSWVSEPVSINWFSPVVSAAVDAIVDAYAQSATDAACSRAGAAAEPTNAPESSRTGDMPSGSTGPLAAPGVLSSQTPSTSQSPSQNVARIQKRGREDGEDEPGRRRAPKRKRIEEGNKRLACPFQKRYPLKHFFCGTGGTNRGFDIIAHLKEHIWRCHIRPRMFCPRCKAKFDDSQNMADHILQYMATESCENRPFHDDTALPWSPSLAASLKARVNRKWTLHEQWFSVWNILFPDVEQPDCCLVEDGTCEHIFEYQQFILNRGHDIVRTLAITKPLYRQLTTLIGYGCYSCK